MKKIFIGLFILLCGFVLASCGNDGGKTETPKVEYNKKVEATLEEGSDYNPDLVKLTFKEGERITDYAKVIANNTNNSYDDVA